MGKVYYVKEKHDNKFRIERVFDLAGRIILNVSVLEGKIKPGMTGSVNSKEFVIENVEVRNQRIEYLIDGESGDLILKGLKAAKLEEEDFKVGLVFII